MIDSKIGAYALGKMIKNGIDLEKQGKSYEEIVAELAYKSLGVRVEEQ